MKKRNVILISGVTGALGKKLSTELGQFYEIYGVSRSLNKSFDTSATKIISPDQLSVDKLIALGIDIVIHCAVKYDRNNSPLEVIDCNVSFAIKLFEISKNSKVKTFINCDTALKSKTNTYSLTKRFFRDYLFLTEGMKIVNLKFDLIYGKAFSGESSFIHNLINGLIDDGLCYKMTKGEQKRYMINIEDVVSAFITILNNEQHIESHTEFNVFSSEAYEIRDIALKVKTMLNSNTDIIFGYFPYRDHELMLAEGTNVSLKKLGWAERYSLDEGLKALINEHKN